MTSEEEIAYLREELAKAQALIAQLRAEIERLGVGAGGPASFIKPSTPKSKEKAEKKARRKRAKDQNGTRRREMPTQMVEHKLEQCPDCAYPLRHPTLAKRR